MMPMKTVNGVVGTISLGWTTIAAANYNEWPPYIAGAALGTLAFLWSIKGAAEDKRYKSLMKRLDDSEADIDAGRKDRQQITAFYSAQIEELKEKYRGQIEELEQAKLKILLELQEAHAVAKRELAVDASVARAMVAMDTATAKASLLADASK